MLGVTLYIFFLSHSVWCFIFVRCLFAFKPSPAPNSSLQTASLAHLHSPGGRCCFLGSVKGPVCLSLLWRLPPQLSLQTQTRISPLSSLQPKVTLQIVTNYGFIIEKRYLVYSVSGQNSCPPIVIGRMFSQSRNTSQWVFEFPVKKSHLYCFHKQNKVPIFFFTLNCHCYCYQITG